MFVAKQKHPVEFGERLVTLRKQRDLTQKELAEKIGIHVIQVQRYEAGTSQPTLDVVRRMAIALGIRVDELVFEPGARGPDDDLRLQFEAISSFSAEEKKIAKAVLEGLILKHEAKRWSRE